MTPRTVRGSPNIDFANQVARQQREQKEQQQHGQSHKRFRSSAAPKGTKLAPGYRDRAQDRLREGEGDDDGAFGSNGVVSNGRESGDAERDDRARRVQALEESMKLGQIDRATFERLRDDITGGDIRATHLVKGLDRRLLERVRRGEDVLSGNGGGTVADGKGGRSNSKDATTDENNESGQGDMPVDIDEEFAQLEQKEIVPIAQEKTEKKGIMAPPPPPSIAGTKRSRNAILAQLKASRQSLAEHGSQGPASASASATGPPGSDDMFAQQQQQQLGSKFRRIGEKQQTSRIERDERGREVLVIRDRNGKVIKRKVRKVESNGVGSHAKGQAGQGKNGKGGERGRGDGKDEKGLLVPTNTAQPLGAEVSDLVSAASAAAAAKRAATGEDGKEGEEDEGDIFEGVGDEYDPLGSDASSDGGDDNDNNEDGQNKKDTNGGEMAAPLNDAAKINGREEIHTAEDTNLQKTENQNADMKKDTNGPLNSTQQQQTQAQPQPARPRDYFATGTISKSDTNATSTTTTSTTSTNPLADPTLLAALKRASAIHKASDKPQSQPQPQPLSSLSPATKSSKIPNPLKPDDLDNDHNHDVDDDNENTRTHQHVRLRERLQARARASDRDLEDLDLGFGSSRFGDAEDMELDGDGGLGKLAKLAEWRGGGAGVDDDGDDDGDDDDGAGTGGKKGRAGRKETSKSKKKKKKGDKNSVGDVLGVMERLRSERGK